MNRRTWLKSLVLSVAVVTCPEVAEAPRKKFNRCVMPIITRMHPKLIARELISVQPMGGPTGLVFHMNFVTHRTLFQRFIARLGL